jgi:hypothetical protein
MCVKACGIVEGDIQVNVAYSTSYYFNSSFPQHFILLSAFIKEFPSSLRFKTNDYISIRDHNSQPHETNAKLYYIQKDI